MEFLKALFGEKALSYDDFVQAINAHNGDEANKDKQIKLENINSGNYVSKLKYEDIVQQLSDKQTEIGKANGLIAELQKGTKGNEELQGKVAEYEQQVAQLQEKSKKDKLDYEIKLALLEAKATDIDYLTFKLVHEHGEELEIGEDGKIKGIDEKITGLKTQFPSHFEAAKQGKKVDELKLGSGDGTESAPQSFADVIKQHYENN